MVPSNFGVLGYLKPRGSWNGGNRVMSKVGRACVWTTKELEIFLIFVKLLSPPWAWEVDTWLTYSWLLPPSMLIFGWCGRKGAWWWKFYYGWLKNSGLTHSLHLPCGSCYGCSKNKGLALVWSPPFGSFLYPWCSVFGGAFPSYPWYRPSGMWFAMSLCSPSPGRCWPWWKSLSCWFDILNGPRLLMSL